MWQTIEKYNDYQIHTMKILKRDEQKEKTT